MEEILHHLECINLYEKWYKLLYLSPGLLDFFHHHLGMHVNLCDGWMPWIPCHGCSTKWRVRLPPKKLHKTQPRSVCFTDQCRYKVREVYTTHCNFYLFFSSCLFPFSLVPIHIKICYFALQHPFIHISYIHIPLQKKKRPGDVSQSRSSRTRVGWTGLGMQVPWVFLQR